VNNLIKLYRKKSSLSRREACEKAGGRRRTENLNADTAANMLSIRPPMPTPTPPPFPHGAFPPFYPILLSRSEVLWKSGGTSWSMLRKKKCRNGIRKEISCADKTLPKVDFIQESVECTNMMWPKILISSEL